METNFMENKEAQFLSILPLFFKYFQCDFEMHLDGKKK